MRYFVRSFFVSTFSIWLTSQILPTLYLPTGWQLLLTTGLVFSLILTLVLPILKILFIPIHLMTFGLLSWLVHVLTVYLLTVIVPEVQIRQWTFSGFTTAGFIIPKIHFTYAPALIVTSLVITFFINLFHKINEG